MEMLPGNLINHLHKGREHRERKPGQQGEKQSTGKRPRCKSG